MSRLRGLIGGELKPRRLDRPMIGGLLERSQPIAALDLRARKLLACFVRTQRRLARRDAGGVIVESSRKSTLRVCLRSGMGFRYRSR